MRTRSPKPHLRLQSKRGMSEPSYPSDKSVEAILTLRAYRDQDGIFGPNAKPGFILNGQVSDNHQDAVVAVAEVLNQFRYAFTEGRLPEYAEAFGDALRDHMAKHWPGPPPWEVSEREL